MLKRYYQLTEAAEFLSKEESTTISIRDILELVARGEVRACFWFDDVLTTFRYEGLFAMPTSDAAPLTEAAESSSKEKSEESIIIAMQDILETVERVCKGEGLSEISTSDAAPHSFLSFRGYVQVPAGLISPNGEILQFNEINHKLIIEVVDLIYDYAVGKNYMSPYAMDWDTCSVMRKEFQVVISDILIPAEDLLAISSKSLGKESTQQNQNKSDELAYLNQASVRYWDKANKDDKTTHPANSVVSQWLQEKGLTKTLADKGASIIRPKWAAVGRKPDE